jgi:flagellar biosynthesis component FlhA
VGNPETPVAAIASTGSRYFLRQMVEPTIRNLFFISHNEVPMEVKIVSLGAIQ